MGMGWGMAQALGNAISRSGNVLGPDRLDMRRELDEDARRAAAHEAALKMSKYQLESGEFDLGQRRELAPLIKASHIGANEGQTLRNEGQRTLNKNAALELEDLEQKLASMPPGFHRDQFELELAQKRASINASNSASAAAAANLARDQSLTDIAKLDLQRSQEEFNLAPGVFARRQMAPEIANIHKAVQRQWGSLISKSKIDPMTGKAKEGFTGADADAYRAAYPQIEQYAAAIARGLVENYEYVMQQRKQPAWSHPSDREGAIKKETTRILLGLLKPSGDVDPIADAGAAGGAPGFVVK